MQATLEQIRDGLTQQALQKRQETLRKIEEARRAKEAYLERKAEETQRRIEERQRRLRTRTLSLFTGGSVNWNAPPSPRSPERMSPRERQRTVRTSTLTATAAYIESEAVEEDPPRSEEGQTFNSSNND